MGYRLRRRKVIGSKNRARKSSCEFGSGQGRELMMETTVLFSQAFVEGSYRSCVERECHLSLRIASFAWI